MPSCVEVPVIELNDDDDDDKSSNDYNGEDIEQAIKKSLCDQWRSVCKKVSTKSSNDGERDIIEIGSSSSDDDDDIEVIDASIFLEQEKKDLQKKACEMSFVKTEEEDDDDVMVVGKVKSLQLPHMRQHCTEYPFICDVRHLFDKKKCKEKANEGLECNSKYCQLCYCYVCDIPASECKKWYKLTKGKTPKNNSVHCLASDTGINSSFWNRLRLSQRTTKQKKIRKMKLEKT